MKETKGPVNIHNAYHAHIYFNAVTKDIARKLCEEIGKKFELSIGKFHEKLVGPHPCWSCQITFEKKDYDAFIPWLKKSRQNLTVFIHALTGDDWKDHTDFAYWLGAEVKLNLSIFAPMK